MLHKLKLFELTPPRLRAKMPQQIYGFKWSLHFLVRTCCSCGFNGRWHLAILPLAKPKPQQQRQHNLTLHLASPPHHTPYQPMIANKPTLPLCRRTPISSSSKGLQCLFCPRHFKNMRAMGQHSRWCDGHYHAWCRRTPFEWSPSTVIDIDRKAHVPVSIMVSLILLIVHCLIIFVPHVKYHIL